MRRLIAPFTSLVVLLSACTLPFAGQPTQPSPVPPTATTLGVALPPIWTPTPAAAVKPTPRPTSSPEAEPTQTPAIVVTALRLTDLPAGYSPAQPISFGLSPAALSAGVLKPPTIAMFEDTNTGVLVISVAAALGSPSEELAFTQRIETPATMIEVLAGVLGQLEGTARALEGYGDIGTAGSAAEGRIMYRGFRYDLQVALLRQGPIAAYIGVMVPRGEQPGFDLRELALAYAGRLKVSNIVGAPTLPAP